MRGWIPILPLACGLVSLALSWVALFEIARAGSFAPSFLAFGWIHLVALGWVTLVALAILLHVIPGFLDVEWPLGPVARWATLGFAAGVAVLLAGFFARNVAATQWGSSIAFAALAVYGAALVQPLLYAMRGERIERAVARAFGATFVLLLVAAAFGVAFTYAFGARLPASILATAPQAHAFLGIGGWLTLLVVGVSARTMRPICGVRSRSATLHVWTSSSLLLGTLVAALGAATANSIALAGGCMLLLLGTLLYALDIADVLRRATMPHRPPQAFMAFACTWALAGAALALGAAFGRPWGAAAIYVALLGWVGSAVMAHLHHIGVRALLTNLRGEDDETRPGTVLRLPLTWATLASYQTAVLVGSAGILAAAPALVELASAAGFLGFVTMIWNLGGAIKAARPEAVPSINGSITSS